MTLPVITTSELAAVPTIVPVTLMFPFNVSVVPFFVSVPERVRVLSDVFKTVFVPEPVTVMAFATLPPENETMAELDDASTIAAVLERVLSLVVPFLSCKVPVKSLALLIIIIELPDIDILPDPDNEPIIP